MEKKEARKLCIYTKKDETQAHFENREHIIPACIGGMKKLEQGYVSDEANALFSGMELRFARESPVSTVRMFVGPGKRGSHNPRKKGGAGKKVSVMQSHENGAFSLGYIQMGTPIIIDQVKIERLENGHRQIQIGFDSSSAKEEEYQTRLEGWFEKLEQYDNRPRILREEKLPEGTLILGQEGKQWYLAAAPGKADEELKEDMKKELALLKSYYKGEGQEELASSLESARKERSQVTAAIHQAFNIDEYFQVIAKIAFNCLAELRGQDYVLQEKFDEIREAVLTGKEIESLVKLAGEEGREKQGKPEEKLEKIAEERGFGIWRHTVTISRIPQGLIAIVCLYGSASPAMVWLSKEDCREFGEIDGFICDWENKRELHFLDFVAELVGEPKEGW